MTATKRLDIEIASDVICPWCFIGKRRFEKALTLLEGELEVGIKWLPFELNPDMPEAGIPRAEYRTRKFGSLEKSRALDARVAGEARGEGLEFAFERMQRTPNTLAAHRLIDFAQEQGKGDGVVEALFKAYFLDAQDIGDRAVLRAVAQSQGIAPAALDARLEDAAERQRVATLAEDVREMGISAVPTFVLGRRYGVSGAHPPEVLAEAIRKAAA
jgi:predicted DsbA family dithiol-disulfide isomerase